MPSGSPGPSPSLSPLPSSNANPDLTVDENGLSKATVILSTTQGVIRFKFFPVDAPNTVKRLIELINQGFYNGLTWHRVVPGFVIQVGDPQGTGSGGSGQKLKAEFNKHRHIEGTLGMARGGDKDSADSQFYITLGASPHLDHNYTVFGQVIDGIDAARKIRVGDKVTSIVIQ
jgi:cyclophilin family peptidyl-prolyl cis-trans isomerase